MSSTEANGIPAPVDPASIQDEGGDAVGKSVRAPGAQRASRAALAKVLPTDRLTPAKQMSVMRAYGAASGPAHKAVSIHEVAEIIPDLVASSVSLCNPFFTDIGLIQREGTKFRPADALHDYLHAWDWDPDGAALKLRSIFSESWAAKCLLPKLAFRPFEKVEAINFLAQESRAAPGHRKSLETILEFLAATGVVRVEGNTVTKAQVRSDLEEPVREAPKPEAVTPVSEDVHRLEIPIPEKDSVVVLIPKSLDEDDWAMFQQMFQLYVKRWKKFGGEGAT